MINKTWRTCGNQGKLRGKYGKLFIMNCFQGKKVFVTGHTGFKGSWLLCLLDYLGAELMGYALEPNTNPNLFSVIKGDKLCRSVIGDIRDVSFLQKNILDFKPDFIFHLAAQPIVLTSYKIPAETFEVNTIGTANVLDGMKLLDKPCIGVMITTDKVYENSETGQAYKETDRLGGYDPYSASKACAELVIDSYRKSFFNPDDYDNHNKSIASARAGNVIGGGDWASNRLIPDIVRALFKKEIIQIRNPQAVRPWQHVLEPLVGYITLAEKLVEDPTRYAQGYNFGPHSTDLLTVEDMVKLAVDIWGEGNFEFSQSPNQPHEAGLLLLDITKAEKELNWKPKHNAREALYFALQWYKTYYKNSSDIVDLTFLQIDNYWKNINQQYDMD